MILVKETPKGLYNDLYPYFDDLPEDQYADKGYRFRRFSSFKQSCGVMDEIEVPHFMQSKDLNSAFGDIERKFEPLDKRMVGTIGFKTMVRTFMVDSGCNKIDVHQVRIVVDPEKGAPAAPEGQHQDGYDRIGVFIVTRQNIEGGTFMLWDRKDAPWEDYIFKSDMVGHYGIVDDTKYFHTGDNLRVKDSNSKGIWEWFVIGGML